MEQGTRTLQPTDNRSLLLELYKQRDDTRTTTEQLVYIQDAINHIIAQNYLFYVNR